MFEKEPVWTNFAVSHKFTLAVKNYWTKPELGGGKLTGDLLTSDGKPIKTPLAKLIKDATHFGFYEIDKI